MYNTTDQLLQRINESKDQIKKLFVDQCKFGQQTSSLTGDAKVAACGQFLNVQKEVQRGLHGTAAAIRVLGEDTRQETVDLVSKMIEYIRHRENYEPADLGKCRRDSNNVVKLSEAIIALHRIPAASDVVEIFSRRLREGFTQGHGWSWFLDNQGDQEPYSTAFACYALSQIGPCAEVDGARRYLMQYMNQNNPKNGLGKRHADIITDVFCLYVLTVVTIGQTNPEERQVLGEAFDRIWHRLEPLLDDDLEQNIEYWDKSDTCYVRIPWQLYLLALASHYRIHRRFSSWVGQTKLVHILDMVKVDSYVYPYSGKFLSSRTYGILYEILEMIQLNIEHRRLLPLFLLWDRVVRLLRTKVARFLVFIICTGIVAYVCFRWYPNRNEGDYSKIFNGIIAAWLLAALSWAQRGR